jgi:hypothetical protein
MISILDFGFWIAAALLNEVANFKRGEAFILEAGLHLTVAGI